MKKISNKFSLTLLATMLAVQIASCGSDTKKTISSSTTPVIVYSNSAAFHGNVTFTWGVNTYGQLGNGDTNALNKQIAPVSVLGAAASGMDGVAVGGTHLLAFKNNGNVYAWGNNSYGQLGDNMNNVSALPVVVFKDALTPLSGVIDVSAGLYHSVAIVDDGSGTKGTVWAWGDNSWKQLGDTVVTSRIIAGQVSGVSNVTKISAGGGHNLALINDGTVMSWGYNQFGQLGLDISGLIISTPGTISGFPQNSTVVDIAAGGSHSLFLVKEGATTSVWACGYNHYGQLGRGTTSLLYQGLDKVMLDSATPLQNVLQVAAGLDHSLAIVDDGSGTTGTVWAWGYNLYGQLGNGNTFDQSRPVQVLKGSGSPLTDISKIVAVGNHSLALDKNGKLWAWGDNTYGQLGINSSSTVFSFVALPVSLMTSDADLYHRMP